MLDQTTGPGGHTELIITKGVKEVCPPSSSSSAEEGKSAGFSGILCIGHTGQSHLSLFKTSRHQSKTAKTSMEEERGFGS